MTDPHNDRIRWAEQQAGVYDDEEHGQEQGATGTPTGVPTTKQRSTTMSYTDTEKMNLAKEWAERVNDNLRVYGSASGRARAAADVVASLPEMIVDGDGLQGLAEHIRANVDDLDDAGAQQWQYGHLLRQVVAGLEDMLPTHYPDHEETADALAAAGLLAPEPIPLDEGDRSEVLDALLNARQNANIFGPRHQTTAWEVAALLFDAHTTAAHAQKEETNE